MRPPADRAAHLKYSQISNPVLRLCLCPRPFEMLRQMNFKSVSEALRLASYRSIIVPQNAERLLSPIKRGLTQRCCLSTNAIRNGNVVAESELPPSKSSSPVRSTNVSSLKYSVYTLEYIFKTQHNHRCSKWFQIQQ